MKKASRPRREQPNMDLTERNEPQQDENFSLEDIISEFGGWSKRGQEETEPVLQPEPDTQTEPEPALPPPPEPEAQAEPEPALPPPPEPEVQTEPEPALPSLPDTKEASYPSPGIYRLTQEPATSAQPQRRKRKRPPGASSGQRRGSAPKPPVTEYPSPEAAFKNACKAARGISAREKLMAFWCFLAVATTFLNYLQLSALPFLNSGKTAAAILLGLLLVSTITGYDVLVRGVYHCLKGTFGLDSLLSVATVVFAVDGFSSVNAGKIPYTAVLIVGLFYALWAEGLQNKAKRRALKAVLGMPDTISAAVMERKAYRGRDCVFRVAGTRENFVAALEAPDGASNAMRVYTPAVMFLSLVLAGVLYFLRDTNFLWSWSAMLAGSIPAAAFVVYWRPFAALCGNLQRSGAALCGWQGVKAMGGKAFVALEDRDLFSPAGISMNGMKVFGGYNVSEVVGYTYAVIAALDGGLEPTFAEVFANQNGRQYRIDNFKRYEGGGVGAEIQGEVILVGSIGFMQLMGVRMPEGTNVRQAVYCAVNGELAAVFAINYNPSSAVRSGLQMVLRCKGLSLLLATRDFILTPAFLRHKYKIPADSMEYPGVAERAQLSDPEKQSEAALAALLSRESFLALAEAVTGGRNLLHSVQIGVGVSLLGGILGFVITLMLSFIGAFAVASAMNLMAFTILWTLPVLLLTAIAGK